MGDGPKEALYHDTDENVLSSLMALVWGKEYPIYIYEDNGRKGKCIDIG